MDLSKLNRNLLFDFQTRKSKNITFSEYELKN